MISLAPHTTAIFDKAIQLDCIKPYYLVGGTALSLQLGTRMSEDLDFMRWRTSKAERMEVAWKQLQGCSELLPKDLGRKMQARDRKHKR